MIVCVAAVEALGPYHLVSLERGFEPGAPGQFHMLRALDAPVLLARPLSAIDADQGRVRFLCQVRGPGLTALARPGAHVSVEGPFGRGFVPAAGARGLLVGGGFGAALLAGVARAVPDAVLLAAFRDSAAALAAQLVPAAQVEIVLDPEPLLARLPRALEVAEVVYAAGPRGLVSAVAAACGERGVPCQVALEAPMACGYGSCHGCAVELDGQLARLCVEGPVVDGARIAA